MNVEFINRYNHDSGIILKFDNGERYTVKPSRDRRGPWNVFESVTQAFRGHEHFEEVQRIADNLGVRDLRKRENRLKALATK